MSRNMQTIHIEEQLWNGVPTTVTYTYMQSGDTVIVQAQANGWGGMAFQGEAPTHETPEELVEYCREYSLHLEALADANLNAARWNYKVPF